MGDCSETPTSVEELCPFYHWVNPQWNGESFRFANCGGVAVAYNFDGSGCYGYEVVWNELTERVSGRESGVLMSDCKNLVWGEVVNAGTIQCGEACTQSYAFCNKSPTPSSAPVSKALLRDERTVSLDISKAELDDTDQSEFPLRVWAILEVKQEIRWKQSPSAPPPEDPLDTWYWTLTWAVSIDRKADATPPYGLEDYVLDHYIWPFVVKDTENRADPCPP